MQEPFPLPDFQSEVRGSSTERLITEEMEYLVEEMYDFLPNLDIPDDIRLRIMDKYIKDLENFKKSPNYFQTWIEDYETEAREKKSKVVSLRVPDVITDYKRIEQMFEYGEVVKRRMMEAQYPVYLRMTIEHCLKMVWFNLMRKAINCTRNMWRAVKMILLGTEKENKRDAEFFILLGILNLKEAVAAEFARARAKKD
ncbi:uncharacterized protein [Halyomorpha halys]|uniref:uncharacterized protein n=1 Tax=Halyomorpha halys TaxID=286706 RepID=UPI0006D4DC95|nr:uncharacterized protein LOC106689215 [Halyomorpha halys]